MQFIEMLEQDAAHADRVAEDWAEVAKSGGRLEDSQGNIIATAEEMVRRFRAQAKMFRDLIAQAQQNV